MKFIRWTLAAPLYLLAFVIGIGGFALPFDDTFETAGGKVFGCLFLLAIAGGFNTLAEWLVKHSFN